MAADGGRMIVRLNKFIAECGVASRRGADKLISDGKVKVNGAVVTKLGVEINDKSDVVSVDGVVLKQAERKVYLMMNKPKGCVCTAQDEDKNRKTVYDYLETDVRVFSVGRLDYDSEGLLLFTNDGELANYLTHPSHEIPKTYVVKVEGEVPENDLALLRKGVTLDGVKTKRAKIKFKETEQGGKIFKYEMTIFEGKNRQIRRMCEYLGYHVCTLKRIRIMNLTLDGLKCGEYREIRGDEWKKLNELIRDSSSETVIRTGGQHGNISGRTNKRTGAEAERSSKGILSGRPGDHEQQRVRRTVRSTGKNGKGNRNRSGRQSNC